MLNNVPETLDEAFTCLRDMATPEELAEFLQYGPNSYHHVLGRHLRNAWGFWRREGRLYEWLVSLGLQHPDDMSGLILESFHRHMQGCDLDLAGQVRHYQAFWAAVGVIHDEK